MNINATLSPREDEVTELLAWGASSKMVASKLFISEDTVVNHRRNIFHKLGLHSIGQLCAWFFCKKFNIPMSLNPIPMICLFFMMLTVAEMKTKNSLYRKATTVQVKHKRFENDIES